MFVCILAGDNEIVMSIKHDYENVWAARDIWQLIANSSSQYDDKGGCSYNLYCKCEMNLRLFAIWLVTVKLLHQ